MKTLFMYFNIPWEFIKQRPQWLAEELSHFFQITAYYNRPYKQTYQIKQSPSSVDKIQFESRIKIPRYHKSLIFLDNLLQRFFIRKLLKGDEYIWIMHPDQFEILEPLLNSPKGHSYCVIYDCMDLYAAFPHLSPKASKRICELEARLVQRANFIFYTSNTLKATHETLYPSATKGIVVSNAAPHPSYYIPSVSTTAIGNTTVSHANISDSDINAFYNSIDQKYTKLVYIGAISSWFDWSSIEFVLNQCPQIVLILFGPCDTSIPKLDRLYHYGKIPHTSIGTALYGADILVMPFEVNPLILAVDPIKMYEYIGAKKPIIAPDYPELHKFLPYVHLYSTKEDFVSLINNPSLYEINPNIQAFIENNTWANRAQQIAIHLS